jgi:putative transposase
MKRYDTGSIRFVTFSCIHRWPLLKNDLIKDEFVRALAACQQRTGLLVAAWVVMPEHAHILAWPGPRGVRLAPVLSGLKSTFARDVIGRWRELRAPILDRITGSDGRPHFWLPGGGHDENLETDDAIDTVTEYIHNNPVRRGLVERATDYRWSSARAWAGRNDTDIVITSPSRMRAPVPLPSCPPAPHRKLPPDQARR